MKRIILMALLLTSCASYAPTHPQVREWIDSPEAVRPEYYDLILDWQQRVREEGWHSSLIDEIVSSIRAWLPYGGDGVGDVWFTPLELLRRGYGDCEDKAILAWHTLVRELEYPHTVRIAIVRVPQSLALNFPFSLFAFIGNGGIDMDHALVRIEMPDGEWRDYESVPGTTSLIYSRHLVEFDDSMLWVEGE